MVEIIKIGEIRETDRSFKDEIQKYRHLLIKDLENDKEIIFTIFINKFFNWWKEIDKFLDGATKELPLIDGEIVFYEKLDILALNGGSFHPPEYRYESQYMDQLWRLDKRYQNVNPFWIWEK